VGIQLRVTTCVWVNQWGNSWCGFRPPWAAARVPGLRRPLRAPCSSRGVSVPGQCNCMSRVVSAGARAGRAVLGGVTAPQRAHHAPLLMAPRAAHGGVAQPPWRRPNPGGPGLFQRDNAIGISPPPCTPGRQRGVRLAHLICSAVQARRGAKSPLITYLSHVNVFKRPGGQCTSQWSCRGPGRVRHDAGEQSQARKADGALKKLHGAASGPCARNRAESTRETAAVARDAPEACTAA
jgi:hypothetical protein